MGCVRRLNTMSLFLTVYESDHTVNCQYIYGTDMDLVTESFIGDIYNKIKTFIGKVIDAIIKAAKTVYSKVTGIINTVVSKLRQWITKAKSKISGTSESYVTESSDQGIMIIPLRELVNSYSSKVRAVVSRVITITKVATLTHRMWKKSVFEYTNGADFIDMQEALSKIANRPMQIGNDGRLPIVSIDEFCRAARSVYEKDGTLIEMNANAAKYIVSDWEKYGSKFKIIMDDIINTAQGLKKDYENITRNQDVLRKIERSDDEDKTYQKNFQINCNFIASACQIAINCANAITKLVNDNLKEAIKFIAANPV